MDTAKVMVTPHERGAEVDLDVRGMSPMERVGAVWAAVVGVFSGRIHVHLWHARVQSQPVHGRQHQH